jgi:hypothetical protein
MNLAVVNTTEFHQALTQYSRLSKKDLAEIINQKTTSILLNAASITPKGDKASIRNLESSSNWPWWPKLVAKIMRESGFTLKTRRKARGKDAQKAWTDPSTGHVTKGRDRMTVYRLANHTRADMRRVSKSIIKRRAATVGYMRGLFLNVAAKFNPKVRMAAVSSFKRGWRIDASPATPRALMAILSFPVTAAQRSWSYGSKWGNEQASLQFKEGKVWQALQSAINRETASMWEYCKRKLAENSAKVSAKGRA